MSWFFKYSENTDELKFHNIEYQKIDNIEDYKKLKNKLDILLVGEDKINLLIEAENKKMKCWKKKKDIFLLILRQ